MFVSLATSAFGKPVEDEKIGNYGSRLAPKWKNQRDGKGNHLLSSKHQCLEPQNGVIGEAGSPCSGYSTQKSSWALLCAVFCLWKVQPCAGIGSALVSAVQSVESVINHCRCDLSVCKGPCKACLWKLSLALRLKRSEWHRTKFPPSSWATGRGKALFIVKIHSPPQASR